MKAAGREKTLCSVSARSRARSKFHVGGVRREQDWRREEGRWAWRSIRTIFLFMSLMENCQPMAFLFFLFFFVCYPHTSSRSPHYRWSKKKKKNLFTSWHCGLARSCVSGCRLMKSNPRCRVSASSWDAEGPVHNLTAAPQNCARASTWGKRMKERKFESLKVCLELISMSVPPDRRPEGLLQFSARRDGEAVGRVRTGCGRRRRPGARGEG